MPRTWLGVAKNVGEALRKAREQAGLSLRDLSRLSGMSSGYLSQIETGARKDPGFKTVLLLAKSIGVSMDDLARGLEGFAITTRPLKKVIAPTLAGIDRARSDALRIARRLEDALSSLSPPPKKRAIPPKKRR